MTRSLLSLALALTVPALAQEAEVKPLPTKEVRGGVYMLTGMGGNIGLCVGDDGAFLVDDQFAPAAPGILAAIEAVTDQPLKILVNTHWHQDHTGGNETLGQAGALIVAHENVRERMNSDQFIEFLKRPVPASPAAALPVVTFADEVTFHWNGQRIDVIHVDPAHTDGDSVIHFRGANVIHTGDTFFNGMYPFLDVSSGGSPRGMIAAAERVLELCDDETKLIPGHGPLGDKARLRAYRDMLETVITRIEVHLQQGHSLQQVLEAKPTAEFDAEWGKGFLNPELWTQLLYQALSRGDGE